MILEEKHRLTAVRMHAPVRIPIVRNPKTIIGIQPHKYDGVGSFAKNSSTPPLGWPTTIAIAVAVIVVCAFIFGNVGTAVGF